MQSWILKFIWLLAAYCYSSFHCCQWCICNWNPNAHMHAYSTSCSWESSYQRVFQNNVWGMRFTNNLRCLGAGMLYIPKKTKGHYDIKLYHLRLWIVFHPGLPVIPGPSKPWKQRWRSRRLPSIPSWLCVHWWPMWSVRRRISHALCYAWQVDVMTWL